MKKIGNYWKIYICLVLLLVALGIVLVIYTRNCLETYEYNQPERLVKHEMDELQNAAKYKTLSALMDLSKYDEDTINQYYDLMNKAQHWTYKVISGGYSDTSQTWGIYADNTLVAQVSLSGANTRTVLLILTSSEWTVSSLASGLDFAPTPTPGPTEAPIIITKYQYELTLPASYKVVCEGKQVAGTAEADGKIKYSFVSTEEVIKISDAYGTEIDYKYGDTISGHNVVVKIPDVFGIKYKDVDFSQYAQEEKEAIKELEVCYSFADNLPRLTIYQLDDALIRPDFEITDQNGKKVEYQYEGDSVIISNLIKEDLVAEEITSAIDIMEIAEMWSLLMTRDLGSKEESYGYNKITPYIVKNSPLLNIAKSYVRSDIWTISNHVLTDPVFTDESFGGYIRYSENIFSVDVHLTKGMIIRNGTEYRYDTISDTIFFIKNTGNGQAWLMVDMMSNLSK